MKIDVVPRSFFEKRIGQDDVLRILDTHKIISIQSSSGYDSLPPFSPDALLSKNLLCLVFDDYFGIPDKPREQERIAVFTPEMADRIMRFVDDGAMPLIVHCTQGVSRSGAIGHVLDRWFNDIVVRNEADRVYFKSHNLGIMPNPNVTEVFLRFLDIR